MQRGGKAQAARRWKEGKASIRERPAFSMPERYCLSRRGKQYRENSQVSAEVFPEVPRGHPGYAPDAPRQFPCRAFRCSPDVFPQRSPSGFPSPPPKRRRRQAPARGLAAVNSHRHPIRNEPQHPSPLLMGLGRVNTAPTACGPAAPLLMGWVCVCIEPKHPVSQTAAGGKPLLVGLPPSAPTAAPFGTNRRTPAPCSWGGRSSTSRQRHWPAALRPFVIFSSRHLPFPAHMNVVYS